MTPSGGEIGLAGFLPAAICRKTAAWCRSSPWRTISCCRARLQFVYDVIGKLSTMRGRPFEGIATALSKRISDLLASLKGKSLTVLISHPDLNHSHTLFDAKLMIERRADLSP
jgi:hypothetical protein